MSEYTSTAKLFSQSNLAANRRWLIKASTLFYKTKTLSSSAFMFKQFLGKFLK